MAVLVVLLSLLIAYIGSLVTTNLAWIPIGLSSAALALSAIAAFRAELFAFQPAVAGGDIVWLQSQPFSEEPKLALPLFLLNKGYGEGVLEWIALTVTGPRWATPIPFESVIEVDLEKVMANAGCFDVRSMRGQVTRLALAARAVIPKTIYFAPSLNPSEGPLRWSPGRHEFAIYVKTEDQRVPVQVLTFAFTFKPESFTEYRNGRTIVWPNTGYRRELLVPTLGPQVAAS